MLAKGLLFAHETVRAWRARPRPRSPCPEHVVRYGDVDWLLAQDDRSLVDMGLRRGDLEAYRDGRIKHLRRRLADD